MKTVTRDSLQCIVMESSTKKYVLTSESNLWVCWKQDPEGNYSMHEVFLKCAGNSRYDDKNAAIAKIVMLDMAEQSMSAGAYNDQINLFNGS